MVCKSYTTDGHQAQDVFHFSEEFRRSRQTDRAFSHFQGGTDIWDSQVGCCTVTFLYANHQTAYFSPQQRLLAVPFKWRSLMLFFQLMGFFSPRRHFCHSTKSAGENDQINDGWNPLSCVGFMVLLLFMLAHCHIWTKPEQPITVIWNVCDFPTKTSQNKCCGKGPLLTLRCQTIPNSWHFLNVPFLRL